MPESFTFCGTVAHDFAWSRDAHGVILGHIEPGAVRDFAGPAGSQVPEGEDPQWYFPAPTDDWFPSDGPLPKRLPDPEPEEARDAPASHAEPPAPVLTAPPGPLFTTPPAADTGPAEHEL